MTSSTKPDVLHSTTVTGEPGHSHRQREIWMCGFWDMWA